MKMYKKGKTYILLIVIKSHFLQFHQYLQKLSMIKKKGEIKKKKVSPIHNKNQRSFLQSHPQKFLFRFTSGLHSPKMSTYNSIPMLKITKSATATPNSKSKKNNKENFSESVFHIKKNIENVSAFDFQKQMKKKRVRADFRFLFQIGSGGFGRVWKVEQKKTKIVYAMKQMSKAKIISKKSVNSIMNQKELLDQLQNSFIINSCENFQDRDNLYLVMEYLRGGDLRYHMCFYQCFDEEQTKFIVGCIVVALEYIHSCNIIHRDLKPQNIVFQENGYARITDFGVARKRKQQNSQETSGTPGYMAPEVICRMNHSFQADFFALGVIVYELIFGFRPYVGDSRKQIRQKILAHQAKINESDFPHSWNPSCIDFVNRLLKRNKQCRLGYNGIGQIKSHPWLRSISWTKLARKQIIPPFVPGIICESRQYQREMQNSVQSEANEDAVILLRTQQIQNIFKNYDIIKKKNYKIIRLQNESKSNSQIKKFY